MLFLYDCIFGYICPLIIGIFQNESYERIADIHKLISQYSDGSLSTWLKTLSIFTFTSKYRHPVPRVLMKT